MDLTEEQWEILEPLIPTPPRREDGRGRPWRDPRDVLNGILWILRTGAPWKDLPERYPPYQRPATAASRSGSRKGFLAEYSKLWPKTSKSAGR
jgi:transposase